MNVDVLDNASLVVRIAKLEAENAKLREAIHDIERVIARLFALEADDELLHKT